MWFMCVCTRNLPKIIQKALKTKKIMLDKKTEMKSHQNPFDSQSKWNNPNRKTHISFNHFALQNTKQKQKLPQKLNREKERQRVLDLRPLAKPLRECERK